MSNGDPFALIETRASEFGYRAERIPGEEFSQNRLVLKINGVRCLARVCSLRNCGSVRTNWKAQEDTKALIYLVDTKDESPAFYILTPGDALNLRSPGKRHRSFTSPTQTLTIPPPTDESPFRPYLDNWDLLRR